MKRAAVFIYRGGLVYWFRAPEDADRYVFWGDRCCPPFRGGYDEVLLFDRNVVTGRTLERARERLGLLRRDCKQVGNAVGWYGEQVLDEVLEGSAVSGYILAFSGYSGSAKSFLARGISLYRGMPYYKVGRYAREFSVGRYGEELAKLEREDPFVVVRRMAEDMKGDASPVVVVDGFKSVEQAMFLSYALNRPLIGFFVDADFRERMVRFRQDEDDEYWRERDELFREGLEGLRRLFTEVSMSDFGTLKPVADVLERLGYECPVRVWGWDVFGTKRVWLDVYRKHVLEGRTRGAEADEKLKEVRFHRRYVEKYGLEGDAAEMVMEVATAFRFIDDILDEHEVRWGRPSRWVETSPVEASAEAVWLTVRALERAERLGLRDEFLKMFEAVLDAVYYELAVEEGEAECRTEADWERAAGREAHFRAFIALLKGEDPVEYYRQGLEAQRKDDIRGAEKGGRRDTDSLLRRPLWQSVSTRAAGKEIVNRADPDKEVR